jgi:hypothetical protein
MSKLFRFKEIKPNIFLLEFDHEYDMCMTFLRYQEYYESPSPKFRGKKFKILDFMRWYSLKFGNGNFTYPTDWSGFNLPDYVIRKVYDLGIDDPNMYDELMWSVYQECNQKSDGRFYIIGVVKGNGALEHEIAHALFYVDAEYKRKVTKLVKAMPPEMRKVMNAYLLKVGYTPGVFIDETQANMATTTADEFIGMGIKHSFPDGMESAMSETSIPFNELYNEYVKKHHVKR